MQAIYTNHARKRMAQRGITEEDIEAALADPQITYSDPDGNRRFVRWFGDRRVQVVIVDNREPYIIKTVID